MSDRLNENYLKKINDVKIKPVKIKCVEKEKIKGYCMFPELHTNIFVCSRKKTGKSTIIWNILKARAGRRTKIIIISPSVDRDPTYREIVKYFEKRGNEVITFHSIKEDGLDNLRDLMDVIQQENLDDDDQQEEKQKGEGKIEKIVPIVNFGEPQIGEGKEKKPRKEKYISPHYIFVLDDLSRELRSPTVAHLLKTNRWYKADCIVSTQYPNDILPELMKQFSFLLLGAKHTDDKLEEIHQKCDLAIPFDEFVKMYDIATEGNYNFLYVDTVNEQYRKNFNKAFV